MAVDGVNSANNNSGMYAAGAALVGGGAGAAAGWYSRPFLKDGAPTDSFTKKVGENLKEIMTPEQQEIVGIVDDKVRNFKEALNNAKTVEELKDVLVNNAFGGFTDEAFKQYKQTTGFTEQMFKALNLDEANSAKFLDIIEKADNVEDLKKGARAFLDENYAGKTLEEIKNVELTAMKNAERNGAKFIFEQFWDSSKKAFVDCEEGVGKAIKKAAQSIQGKYATIYGAIGAGILGIGTLLCNKAPKESSDTQA